MFTVGLTGGVGSGKSTVARIFAALGVDIIDADLIAREVVEAPSDALDLITDRYGQEILTATGALDRARLRGLVFADSTERVWLENLLHPLIDQRIRRNIAACEAAYCLLVSPLLLETSQHRLVDRVLVVDVSRQSQLRRALLRDQGDRATMEAIIDAQASREQRLRGADDIIDNEGGENALAARVQGLHGRYLAMAETHE